MKLALIIAQLDCGGAERVITLMANYWARAGHQVSLFTFSQRGKAPFFPTDVNVRIIDLNLSTKSKGPFSIIGKGIGGALKLRRSMKDYSPDVIISFIDITNIFVICATFRLGIPIIVSERTDPAQWQIGALWNFMRWILYPLADRVVVQTERAKRYFRGHTLRRCEVIPNPVCAVVENEENDPAILNHEINRKRIVSLGRLIPSKGFDLLIEAFVPLAQVFPEWDVYIYGEGQYRETLQKLILASGAADRIRLAGETNQPFRILRSSHVFVFPSRFEGFPNALCEAMAVGLPVISFDCPSGPREILRDNIDGILVEEISAKSLEAAIRRMLSDESFRNRCSRNAPEILTRFGIDSVMNRWTSLTEEVIGEK